MDVGALEFWPYLANTSETNRRLGLPEMKYAEKEGRLQGSSPLLWYQMKWDEPPWQWEVGRMLIADRHYFAGPATEVRARYLVEEIDTRKIRLYIYFGWIPRNWLGRMLLPFMMSFTRKAYTNFLEETEKAIRQQVILPSASPEALTSEAERKLSDTLKELSSLKLNQKAIAYLGEAIRNLSDDDAYRFRPKVLARNAGVPVHDMLVVLLHAHKLGLLFLSFDLICPHCRGERKNLRHLGEIPEAWECETCDIDFSTSRSESLEVVFHIHPSVRFVEKRFFCAAEPAKKSHIMIQREVEPGSSLNLKTRLEPGVYRFRTIGSTAEGNLVVKDETKGQIVRLESGVFEDCESGPSPELILTNTSGNKAIFVIEKRFVDSNALSATELFLLQEFRDLFPEESLASELKLEVGFCAILFTDIIGSSRMYSSIGDTTAFSLVREHFKLIYETIVKHEGVLVKTMGDATMCAFHTSEAAVRAAVDLQRRFREESVRLRVSINAGSCLAVNLDKGMDYFGNMINLGAKLQAFVETGQIVLTNIVHEDTGVRRFLQKNELQPEHLTFSPDWSEEKIPLHRFAIK